MYGVIHYTTSGLHVEKLYMIIKNILSIHFCRIEKKKDKYSIWKVVLRMRYKQENNCNIKFIYKMVTKLFTHVTSMKQEQRVIAALPKK